MSASSTRPLSRSAGAALVLAVALLLFNSSSARAAIRQDSSPVEVSWSVRPGAEGGADRANFSFEAEPGETISDSIVVENHGRATLNLGVVANDAFNTPDGGIDLLASDEQAEDLGTWVTLDERSIRVPPGQSVTVPFTVEVPDDATSGDHSGGVVTTLRVSDTDSTGNRVVHERRLGTRIHVRVEGNLDPALEFTEMAASYNPTMNPFAPGWMSVRYTVRNAGNVRLRATQQIKVSGAFGLERMVEVADMAELLPGNEYSFEHQVASVWPALKTTTEVVLDPYEPSGQRLEPEPAPVVARTSTQLIPVAQIVAAILLLSALVGALVMRSRSKAKLNSAVDQAVSKALRDAGSVPTRGASAGAPETSSTGEQPPG